MPFVSSVAAARTITAGTPCASAAGRRRRRHIKGIGRSIAKAAAAAGNHLFRVRRMAFGAERRFIAKNKLFKRMLAGFAAIFINGHTIKLLYGPLKGPRRFQTDNNQQAGREDACTPRAFPVSAEYGCAAHQADSRTSRPFFHLLFR